MMQNRLSIIIPTKDRPNDIRRLLESIRSQGIKPLQTIIVDGGDGQLTGLLSAFSDLRIDYIKRLPASLTAQRNAGVKHVVGDAALVCFLDDDIVLEEGSLMNMLKFWEGASADTGGASFNNMSDAYMKPGIIQKLFFVNADSPGRILKSGFQSKLCSLEKTTAVEWLVGCAMVYRKKICDEFAFDEWYSGYARYEDVDFSYRVRRKHKLFVVADAKVKHLNRLEDINTSFSLGRMEAANRLYFVRKNPNLSVPLCYWALFGIFLNNILKGMLHFDRRYIRRSAGCLCALLSSRA